MHWPEILVLVHIIPTCILIGVGLHALYINPSDADNNTIFEIIPFTITLFGIISGLIYAFVSYCIKKAKAGLLQKCKIDRAIGFFFVALCGFFPRTIAIFDQVDVNHINYFFITTLFLMALIANLIFVAGTHKYCTWDKTLSNKIAKWNITIQVIMLLVAFGLTGKYCNDPKPDMICLYQFGFFGLCLAGVQEILEIVFGAVQLKEKYEKKEVKLEDVKVEKAEKEKEPLKLECKICMNDYSEPSRTPRMLKECGHTVCEQCAEQLLRAHNGNHIYCPLCQMVTVVRGPASTLPKNYETMEAMEWTKN